MPPGPDAFGPQDDQLLAGLGASARNLLLQLLLYKTIFLGSAFRSLAEQEPPDVREALLRIHRDSAAEAASLTMALRDWDAAHRDGEALDRVAADSRKRFLEDILVIKEGVVDVGLVAAMNAPTEELRRRLLRLADVDRLHADALRTILGTPTVTQHLARRPSQDRSRPSAVGVERPEGGTLRRALQDAVDDVRRSGSEPTVVALSPDAARHARDEGVIDAKTGRAFGVPVEVDMAWRGECFAVESAERVAYAELITAQADKEK